MDLFVVSFLLLLVDYTESHTSHDAHIAFLELPTSCTDLDGDGTTGDAFDCAANEGSHGLTRAKTDPGVCSGACEAAVCCGMCVITICYYWLCAGEKN